MAKQRISRRRFLTIAGGTLGAGALVCGGAAALLLRVPHIDYVETSYSTGTKGKILIAYASRCGSTGEVAQAVGEALSASGAAVDIRLVSHVDDLSPYQAVIIGSAARMRAILPEAVDFAKRNKDSLSQIPVAYFLVCLTMKHDTPENRATASGYLQPLHAIKEPVSEGLFGGKIDYSKLEPFMAWSLSQDKTGDMKEADYRNWDAVHTWATTVTPALGMRA